jgi:acetyl-CoA C-acetyltransferase
MKDVIIYDGLRTPFGRHSGILSRVRPDDLAADLITELVVRNQLPGEAIEDVILGNTNQAGEDSRNIGRHAALLSGLPVSVAGLTVNRLCGSGIAAVLDAARAIRCNDGEIFIAGGSEVMSRAPWVMAKAESPFSRNQKVEDSTLGARFPNPRLEAKYGNDTMPQTADNIATDLGISRDACDEFALASQQKCATAQKANFFQGEILSIQTPGVGRKAPPVTVSTDEHPRPQVQRNQLATMPSLFNGGVTTAGNSSGINDGAATLLLGSSTIADIYGLKPRARVLAGAVAGVEPRTMGLGPVPASQKALQRAKLSLSDMDVIELNEAFAAQALGCLKQLKIDFDDSRVNPVGGAIALGHPLGASGARIVLSAMRQLELVGGRYALASMCIGVGQGIAIVIERL